MRKITLFLAIIFTLGYSSYNAQSLNFDGINDYVITNIAGPSGSSSRTVECWIKTNNSISTQQVLMDWGAMSPLGSRFTLNLINNGRLRIEVGGNGINSNAQIANGLWHHVAVTYDNAAATKVRIYIDGVLDISGNFTVAVNTTSTAAVQLGRRNDGVNFYQGEMDEVRIWNVVRTPSAILADMNVEYCSLPAGLIGYYKLNEGTPAGMNTGLTTASDLTANMNNGTLMNFSLSGNASNWSIGSPVTPAIDTTISQVGHDLISNEPSATSYLWYDCGRVNPLSGDTLQLFTPSVNGTYAVILTKGVCVDTSACFNFLSVGMNEFALNDQLKGFPNPTKDNFTIQLPEHIQKTKGQVKVFSLDGKIIFENQVTSFSNQMVIDLKQFSDGFYFIQVRSKDQSLVGKILVEH